MAQDSNLRFILNTYELPEQLHEKVLRIAESNVPKSSFNEQYSFVAEVVDAFTRPFQDRFARSLDQAISEGDKRSLHEVIGTEGQGLRTLIHAVDPRKNMHAYEVVQILETHLEPQHFAFVEELASHKAGAKLWGFSAESIARNVAHIRGAKGGAGVSPALWCRRPACKSTKRVLPARK